MKKKLVSILLCAAMVAGLAVGCGGKKEEGGDKGGEIVATGTPEEVAKVEASYTGQYLGPVIERTKKFMGEK